MCLFDFGKLRGLNRLNRFDDVFWSFRTGSLSRQNPFTRIVLAAALWQHPHILILDELGDYVDSEDIWYGQVTQPLFQDFQLGEILWFHGRQAKSHHLSFCAMPDKHANLRTSPLEPKNQPFEHEHYRPNLHFLGFHLSVRGS